MYKEHACFYLVIVFWVVSIEWFKLAVLGVFCMLYWIGVYFCFLDNHEGYMYHYLSVIANFQHFSFFNTVCLPEPKTLICCYKVYCACKTCTMNIILYTPTSVLCSRKFYWKFVHFLRIYGLVFYLINNWKDIIFSTHRFCD